MHLRAEIQGARGENARARLGRAPHLDECRVALVDDAETRLAVADEQTLVVRPDQTKPCALQRGRTALSAIARYLAREIRMTGTPGGASPRRTSWAAAGTFGSGGRAGGDDSSENRAAMATG